MNKDFIIQLLKIWKGSGFLRLASICLLGAIACFVGPWWQPYLNAFLQHQINTEIPDIPIWFPITLFILAIFFTILEYKKSHNSVISEELAKNTEQNSQLANEALFLNIRQQYELTCYSILRRLIIKMRNLGVESLKMQAENVLNSAHQEELVQYIDFILHNVDKKYQIWFFNMRGDGESGKPLLYQFIENYKFIIKKAEELDCINLIKGSPLHNAYINITHVSFKEIRQEAYWEDYV